MSNYEKLSTKPTIRCTTCVDCPNHDCGLGPGQQCCNGVCTEKKRDWMGSHWCPHECMDAPAPLGKPGTCDSGNTWPRSVGQPCDSDDACAHKIIPASESGASWSGIPIAQRDTRCCSVFFGDEIVFGRRRGETTGVCHKGQFCPKQQTVGLDLRTCSIM